MNGQVARQCAWMGSCKHTPHTHTHQIHTHRIWPNEMPMNQRGQNLNSSQLNSTQLSAELDFYLFWIIYECLRPNQFSTAKAKKLCEPRKERPKRLMANQWGPIWKSPKLAKSRIAIRNSERTAEQTYSRATHTYPTSCRPSPLSYSSSLPLPLSSFLFVANSVNVSGDKDVSDAIAARCLVNVINRKSFSAFFQVNLKHILRLRY